MVETLAETAIRLRRGAGASPDGLDRLRRLFDRPLPADYESLLRVADGIEGLLTPNAYISIWPSQDVKSLNDSYAIHEFAPGLILFGTDGGGMGYAFDLKNDMRIVEVPTRSAIR